MVTVFSAFAAVRPVGAVKVERMYGVLSGGRSLEVAAGEALVKFAPSVSAADKAAELSGVGASVIQELAPIGWTNVALASGTPVASGLAMLKNLPGVLAVEPNRVYRAFATPNDPLVSAQWHLSDIHAYSAWDSETGQTNPVTIAMMDSGIQGNHPDLQSKLTGTSQFFDPDNGGAQSTNNPPTAACGHATQTAGAAAAAANNGVDGAGVSWGATLISLKVFNDTDCKNSTDCNSSLNPNCGTSDAAIANAANYAAGLPAALGHRVILNMSIGGTGACSATVQAALTNAYKANVVLVAAAGNDGGAVNSPGNCAGVIPVAATDPNDNIASFSSQGPELAANGLAAPGVNIVTTDMNSATTTVSGTSFSSPITAGVAALILSRQPTWSPASVQQALRNSTDFLNFSASALGAGVYKTQDNSQGAGRLNAQSAVVLAVRGLTAFPTDDDTPAVFPNPFRPATTTSATIVVSQTLRATLQSIKIYTIDGRLVRTLRTQSWDGNNDSGNPVATGTYIVLVTTSGGTSTGKVSVIR